MRSSDNNNFYNRNRSIGAPNFNRRDISTNNMNSNQMQNFMDMRSPFDEMFEGFGFGRRMNFEGFNNDFGGSNMMRRFDTMQQNMFSE